MALRDKLPSVTASWARVHRGECLHAARSVAQADIFEIDWEGQGALLKDFSARPWLVRVLWSRAILAREVRALARLQGLSGVPRLLARAGREGYIMERLAAGPLPSRKQKPPPTEYWGRARRLVDAMHEAGVAHGDLRRKNLLIGNQGEPYLIDFATAMWRGKSGGPLRRFIFEHGRRVDRITFARIKASYNPELLTQEELQWIADEPWYLRVGRFLKRYVYRLRKPRYWKTRARRAKRARRHAARENKYEKKDA